ncbi:MULTISPECIES: DUF6730 family protein [Flavobacteriaceae]|uniref:DUF6730 family protein n=1 Tax=Croceitalea marina TaxID=1775166 RepID=A0ABW5MZX3_9FLAO
MGYKKLDEVMELLTDELDGFKISINRLERLTKNTDNIKIEPDTTEIERMLLEHLAIEKQNNSRFQESVHFVEELIEKSRLVSKVQLWLHYSIWFVTLIIVGYLAFQVSRTPEIREQALAEGEQQVISNLKGYFHNNPEQYQAYLKWVKEKDSVPNQK